MKKRLLAFASAILLILTMALPAMASDARLPRVVDQAHLLSDSEYDRLLDKVDSISNRLGIDVVVITLESLGEDKPEELAEWINENYDFGFGKYHAGTILLIAMESRDWVITSTGKVQDSVNLDARGDIADQVVPYLSAGDYYSAFTTYADRVDRIVTDYDNGIVYRPKFELGGSIGISVVIGLIVALIVVGVNQGKLKSVRFKNEAADYVVADSFNVTVARERFLYRNVSATRKESSSSSSRSSGGGHSSSSGKF